MSVIICEACGEILTEKTDDLSGLSVCHSNVCKIAVRRGILVQEEELNKTRESETVV